MALAKRCDRCGKLYVPEKFIIDGDRVNGVSTIDRNEKNDGYCIRSCYDLCPKCLKSFIDWLDSKGGQNEQFE